MNPRSTALLLLALAPISVRAQDAAPTDAPAATVEAAPAPTAPLDTPGVSTPNADAPDSQEPGKSSDAAGEEEPEREVAVRIERSTNLVGKAASASEGVVGAQQLRERPILRPGELLETVPGVIITQHSGAGKANQFFLRGFNLDHGTDLASSIDGVPINMPSHGHGQGYTDLNFLIPELVAGLRYRKGAYAADQGDFSNAGSIDISYANRLQSSTVEPGLGGLGFKRFLLIGSPGARRTTSSRVPTVLSSTSTPRNSFVYGLELYGNDGPWVRPDNYGKVNGVLRYTRGDERNGLTLSAMGYEGKWDATDQVPLRAISSGLISRFGFIDPTVGGKSSRYSLSSQFRRENQKSRSGLVAYSVDYKLNLWSNFTYFLDDPVRGDQFEQEDKRRVYGLKASHALLSTYKGRPLENEFGLQVRHDDIGDVGLYLTQARKRFNTVRSDQVRETSVAPYFESRVRWGDKFRTTAGLRYDRYRFKVASSIAQNSGRRSDGLLSPKVALAFGPFKNTEFYLNAAQGFHSNDARGTTITRDPRSGDSAEAVTPLVRANQAEIGIRRATGRLQSTLAVWGLDSKSELLFVGDAGTTEASRPSRRVGIELTNFWKPKSWLTIDADVAFSRARFTDSDEAGSRIPGAIEGVAALGASIELPNNIFGALRLRYFGPRPLIEDNSVRSRSTTLLNGRLGYKFAGGLRLSLDAFNLLDSRVSDIDYFYESRLPGEAADGVADRHTHPAESRSLRLSVSRDF